MAGSSTPKLVSTRAGAGIKSRYDVLVDGVKVAEVWQLHNRSFSGAWRAVYCETGRLVTGCFSRAEAVRRILPEAD